MTDDLEERLVAYGESFRDATMPPPMPTLLLAPDEPRHRVSRWRSVAPVAAAAAVVTVAASIGWIVRTDSSRSSREPSPTVSSATYRIPQTITVDGHVLTYVGSNAWGGAWIDGRTITVDASPYDPRTHCGSVTLLSLVPVSSDAQSVRLAAAAYDVAPSTSSSGPTACADIGLSPRPVSTSLDEELAGRTLIDDSTNMTHTVHLASEIPEPSFLPSGYTFASLHFTDGNKLILDGDTRTYTHGTDQTLTIERWGGAANRHQDQVVKTGTVLGHPAVVAQTPGFYDNLAVTWTDGTYSWAVRSLGSPAELTPDQLLEIANSLH